MAELTKYNTEAPGLIYEAINAVMRSVGAVTKDSRNPHDGYKFRGIDAVLNALAPALRDNGVTIVPTVINQIREERLSSKGTTMIYSILTVNYKFYADDGSYIEATVIGEGMDRGDKASNKAMSAAFKYAAFQVLCIPTEEMLDSEVESPEVATEIDDNQATYIKQLLEATDSDTAAFLDKFNSRTVESLPIEAYKTAVLMLETKLGRMRGGSANDKN